MTKYTDNYQLPYPEPTNSVLPQSRDFVNLAVEVDKNLVVAKDEAVAKARWKKGVIPDGSEVREFMYGADREGQYASLGISNTATMTGLPEDLVKDPAAFTAVAQTLGSGVTIKITTYSVYGVSEYTCSSAPSTGDGWSRWKKTAWTDDIPEGGGDSGGSGSGFKTLPLALTAGGGGTATAPTSGSVEYDVNLSPDIHVSRYRFAVRDGNPLWGTFAAQAISLTGITFGGVAKLAGMTTNADGSITFSPWFTGDFGNLAFSYTAPQAPRYNVGGGKLNGTRRTTMPFELWIEVETPVTTPSVGGIGDSNIVAVNATSPLNDSWLAQYCRDKGFFPVIYGQSGDTMENSGNPDDYKWNRWNHLSRPDVVIHANGANDLPETEGGITLQELKDRFAAECAVAAAKISRNQHVALLKSRASGANNAVRLQWNSWLKTLPDPIREWHDIAAPVTANDAGGVLPQYLSSDGIHMNTAGHQAIAAAITKTTTVRSDALAEDPADPGFYLIGG